jgi:hypothetical protein
MSKMCIMQYLSSFFQAFNARFMEILDLTLQNLLIMMVFLHLLTFEIQNVRVKEDKDVMIVKTK